MAVGYLNKKVDAYEANISTLTQREDVPTFQHSHWPMVQTLLAFRSEGGTWNRAAWDSSEDGISSLIRSRIHCACGVEPHGSYSPLGAELGRFYNHFSINLHKNKCIFFIAHQSRGSFMLPGSLGHFHCFNLPLGLSTRSCYRVFGSSCPVSAPPPLSPAHLSPWRRLHWGSKSGVGRRSCELHPEPKWLVQVCVGPMRQWGAQRSARVHVLL